MKRAFLIFSFLFVATIYTEPLLLATEKKAYYCYQCGVELSSSQAVSQMLVGINPDSLLCDECRKEQNKGKADKPTGQAILKYTGGQGEVYFSGYPTPAQSDAFLECYKKMQQYQEQNFIQVAAGGYHLRVDKGGSTLFMTDPYSAEPYSIMAPIKEVIPGQSDSIAKFMSKQDREALPLFRETVYHKIVEVIPFQEVFLLFPDQKDTHNIYRFDPTKNKEQRFTLLKEQKLIELLSGMPQLAKKPESAQQKQFQYVEEEF